MDYNLHNSSRKCTDFDTCIRGQCKLKHSENREWNFSTNLAKVECFSYAMCAKADCQYTHPFGWNPYQNALDLKSIRCQEWEKCDKTICFYLHPEEVEQKYKRSLLAKSVITSSLKFLCNREHFRAFVVPMAYDVCSVIEYNHDDDNKSATAKKSNWGVVEFINPYNSLIFKHIFEKNSRIPTQFYHYKSKTPKFKTALKFMVPEFFHNKNRKTGTVIVPQEWYIDFENGILHNHGDVKSIFVNQIFKN